MMIFATVAATLCALLSGLCLLLVAALVRRLRLLEQDLEPFLVSSRAAALPSGTALPDFSAVATTGAAIGRSDLAGGPSVLAFLSVSCGGCRDQVPDFLALAARVAGAGRGRVIAVVTGDAAAGRDLIAAVEDDCVVITEPDNGPLASLLEVRIFPTFAVLDASGVVVESGSVASMLADSGAPSLAA